MPRNDQNTALVIWTVGLLLAACGPQPEPTPTGPTYLADIKPLIDTHCGECHREGGIAPFALTTFEQVHAQRNAIASVTQAGLMPPVLAAKGCAEYDNDLSLSDAQISTLVAWADADGPLGTAPANQLPSQSEQKLTRVDLTLPMPVTYQPQTRPDDYRCFVIDWPKTEDTYVVGFRANPGNAKVVHHVIAYLAPPQSAAEFVALDEREAGAGYTCFGGPNGSGRNTSWLGAWAPGAIGGMYPADTGIEVKPGSKIILQVHYNTLGKTGDFSDLTNVELAVAPTVKHRAAYLPFTNYNWLFSGGMTIPAHETDVVHTYAVDPTPYMSLITAGALKNNVPFKVYSDAAHQHLLGTKSRQELRHKDGATECLLDVPRWDFHWQQAYWLKTPKTVSPGDQLSIECHWDNSAPHQPVVDGTRLMPRDVDWGEGTTDEMCLGLLYVSE